MADFEFFKKEFEFKGKHAKMAQELWVRDDTERTYFKRLIDLYVAAAVVGFRVDRKAPWVFRQPMGICCQSGFLSDSLYLFFPDFLCPMDFLRAHRTDSDEFPTDAGQLDYHCGINGHTGY